MTPPTSSTPPPPLSPSRPALYLRLLSLWGPLLAWLIVVVGWLDLSVTLPRSPQHCQMTFSRPMFREVALAGGGREGGHLGAYRLWSLRRVEEGEGGMKGWERQPVVFVHGHLGSYRQARSLHQLALEAEEAEKAQEAGNEDEDEDEDENKDDDEGEEEDEKKSDEDEDEDEDEEATEGGASSISHGSKKMKKMKEGEEKENEMITKTKNETQKLRSVSFNALHYYAVDFRREPTAVHGHIIWRQASYLKEAIKSLGARHRGDEEGRRKEGARRGHDSDEEGGREGERRGVVVVGHSYGGIVAKAALMLLRLEEKAEREVMMRLKGKAVMEDEERDVAWERGGVHTLLTLGTPHQTPPWDVEESIARLYEVLSKEGGRKGGRAGGCKSDGSGSGQEFTGDGPSVDEKDRGESTRVGRPAAAAGGTGETIHISISGGFLDTLVWTTLSSLPPSPLASLALAVTTIAMPHVGFSVDHLATLWCRQLLSRLTGALVSSLPPFPPSFSPSSAEERLDFVTTHLLGASPPPSLPPSSTLHGAHIDAMHLHTTLLANGGRTTFPPSLPPSLPASFLAAFRALCLRLLVQYRLWTLPLWHSLALLPFALSLLLGLEGGREGGRGELLPGLEMLMQSILPSSLVMILTHALVPLLMTVAVGWDTWQALIEGRRGGGAGGEGGSGFSGGLVALCLVASAQSWILQAGARMRTRRKGRGRTTSKIRSVFATSPSLLLLIPFLPVILTTGGLIIHLYLHSALSPSLLISLSLPQILAFLYLTLSITWLLLLLFLLLLLLSPNTTTTFFPSIHLLDRLLLLYLPSLPLLLGEFVVHLDIFIAPFFNATSSLGLPPSLLPPTFFPPALSPFLHLLPFVLHIGGALFFSSFFIHDDNDEVKATPNLRTSLLLSLLLSPPSPPPHGLCPSCHHPDGGKQAIYIETDDDNHHPSSLPPSLHPSLGPNFRVFSCDCSMDPSLPRSLHPSLVFCGFCQCTCAHCGGSPLTRSFGRREGGSVGNQGGGKQGLLEVVVGVVLSVLCIAGGKRGIEAPYRCRGVLEAAAWLLLWMEGKEGWRKWRRKRKDA